MTAGTKRRLMSKPVVRCSTNSSGCWLLASGCWPPAARCSVRDEPVDSGEARKPPGASRQKPELDINLLVLSEDAAQRVGDLSEGRSCFDGGDHERNQI